MVTVRIAASIGHWGENLEFLCQVSGGGRLTSHQFLFFGGGFNGNYLRSSPLFVV